MLDPGKAAIDQEIDLLDLDGGMLGVTCQISRRDTVAWPAIVEVTVMECAGLELAEVRPEDPLCDEDPQAVARRATALSTATKTGRMIGVGALIVVASLLV